MGFLGVIFKSFAVLTALFALLIGLFTGLVHLPHWSYGNVAITSLQLLGLGGCANELQGQNAGYSKFAHPEKKWKVQSRTGILLLYSPALAVALNYLWNAPKEMGNGCE